MIDINIRSKFFFLGVAAFIFVAPRVGLAQAPSLPGAPVPDFFEASAPSPAEEGFSREEDFGFNETEEERKEQTRKAAFDAALQSALPLRPEEIRTLLEHYDRTQESVETPIYPDPKPKIVVETLSLDPGAKPAVMKVAYGHVSSLGFLDASGEPWPIEDISWAGNFDVMDTGEAGSHLVRITPQSEFARGNMSIRLLTLKTPVIMMLETSRDVVHYRFDAIIPEYGPLAEAPLIETGISTTAGNKNISSVLQGIAPKEAKKLVVSGADGRTTAYAEGDVAYLRTPLTLLSPSWSSSVTSADGMRVYTISKTPVLLLSDGGKMVRVRLSDREDVLE